MNREHYLSKRWRPQLREMLDRQGQHQAGADDRLPLMTESENKPTTAANLPKPEEGGDPGIKPGTP